MANIYIAGPLFNRSELELNMRICTVVESCGHKCFLPQRDGGEISQGHNRKSVFEADIAALEACDVVVAILDGRVPDEGTCWEMGYAYARGKRIVEYTTDTRSFMNGHQNNMLEFSKDAICKDLQSLQEAIAYVTKGL